jgi:hypothetical protein
MGLQSCDNCRKRWEPTCRVYKQENRRPKDSDWCCAWRQNTENDRSIQKAIADIKSIVAVLDPEGFRDAEQRKKEREEKVMGACEKCWGDAYMRVLSDSSKSQAEHYEDLLRERKDHPCSQKEQEGQFGEEDIEP